MSVVYYITAHGFGHFVRSAAVIKELPAEVPLIVRTDIPEWFVRRELAGRPYKLYPAGFDCGTLGPDSASVDIPLTFETAARLIESNAARLQSEVRFLKSQQARVVVSDMPSFPLVAAREAGVPSICETNFTWVEIYAALAARARAEGRGELADRGDGVVAALRAQYDAGDLLLVPGMELPMDACRARIKIPVIARAGKARRGDLCRALGFDPARPLCLLYLGQEGYEGMRWERLDAMPELQFFGFRSLGAEADRRVKVLPTDLMDHSDATATADAVVGKLGYSLCAECAATRRPLVFPPRPDFVEAEALGRAMMEFGLGVPLEAAEFREARWTEAIELGRRRAAVAGQPDCSGAQVCAEIIKLAWSEGSLAGLTGGAGWG